MEPATTPVAEDAKERVVIIVGASYAGLQVAHKMLKHAQTYANNLKVYLVSKNSHLYWNMASVRAVVPGQIRDDIIFGDIAQGFAQYSSSSFQFIVGAAESVNTTEKTIIVSALSRSAAEGHENGLVSEQRTLTYDQLVLCSGSRCANTAVPWKSLDSTEETEELLHATTRRIDAAKHIVVAGGGATGVELAGELGFEYGHPKDSAKKKDIILVSSDAQVLAGDQIAKGVEKELTKLGVKIVRSAKVTGTEDKDGQTVVKLSNGEELTTDCYLPTMGLTPNSEYMDDRFKTEKGYINVDDCLRVIGAPGVWACGDIVSKPRAGYLITENQAAGVASNVEKVMRGQEPSLVKGLPRDMMVCATGRKRGVGRMGKIPLPSLGIWIVKGRTLGYDRMPAYLKGTHW